MILKPQEVTALREHIEWFARNQGWRVNNFNVHYDGKGDVPLGIAPHIMPDDVWVTWEFWWRPADKVFPDANIACRPALDLTDAPTEDERLALVAEACRECATAMQARYVARAEVLRQASDEASDG